VLPEVGCGVDERDDGDLGARVDWFAVECRLAVRFEKRNCLSDVVLAGYESESVDVVCTLTQLVCVVELAGIADVAIEAVELGVQGRHRLAKKVEVEVDVEDVYVSTYAWRPNYYWPASPGPSDVRALAAILRRLATEAGRNQSRWRRPAAARMANVIGDGLQGLAG
jgi:hypothetical protein